MKNNDSFSFSFPLPYIPYSEFGNQVVYCGVLVLLEVLFRAI
jgi:hypothetical protein